MRKKKNWKADLKNVLNSYIYFCLLLKRLNVSCTKWESFKKKVEEICHSKSNRMKDENVMCKYCESIKSSTHCLNDKRQFEAVRSKILSSKIERLKILFDFNIFKILMLISLMHA